MSKTNWLSGANHVDLSKGPWWRGNGPFAGGKPDGVCLHVNVDEYGTPISFWENNSGQVTPNFQVMKTGHIDQLLPVNWQPWCQVNGNFRYAAIETAGLPSEAFTDEQMHAIARILRVYHNDYGVPYRIANHPGDRGFIIHSAGGAAWGGHSCPGTIRANERANILEIARTGDIPPEPKPPVIGKPHLREKWPKWMPEGDLFGNIKGPNNVHGGINDREKAAVKLIQQRFIAEGCVPGEHSTKSSWADGIWEVQTDKASIAWHKKHHRGGHPAMMGRVDWLTLFTY